MKKYIVFLFALIILAGCGSGGMIPPDAKITITSPDFPYVETDLGGGNQLHTSHFTIQLMDNAGKPLASERDIDIYFPYAAPDAADLTQFYDGAIKVNSPFRTRTDSNGQYILRMDFKSGGTPRLSYTANLEVKSGPVSATFAVSVN